MFPSAFPKPVIDIEGNASTATKLQTARTINGVNFDGSSNIIVPVVADTGNRATINTILRLENNHYNNPTGDPNAFSDYAMIGFYYLVTTGTTNIIPDSGYLEIATYDNGNEPIVFKQYNTNGDNKFTRTLYLMDENGNAHFPGTITAKNFIQSA